jgi:hypothetical protein
MVDESIPQHPEDVDPDKEYEVKMTFRMASFLLNASSFLLNNAHGDMEQTVQSFELAMNDLRAMGSPKYNTFMEQIVEILKTDPLHEMHLTIRPGGEENQPKEMNRFITPESRFIQ